MIELVPESYLLPLDPAAIFGRNAPLEVDLGCGDGSFVSALARAHPETNFLGVERLVGRARSTAHKGRSLTNLRVLLIETSYAVEYLLPPESVTAFHLLFPDPWPKRRHQRRRLVSPDFLASIAKALTPGGRLRFVTDQLDYFEHVSALAKLSPLQPVASANGEHEYPTSTFERRFQRLRAPIYRLELRKMSPVR